MLLKTEVFLINIVEIGFFSIIKIIKWKLITRVLIREGVPNRDSETIYYKGAKVVITGEMKKN
jgi:hypothetical protein